MVLREPRHEEVLPSCQDSERWAHAVEKLQQLHLVKQFSHDITVVQDVIARFLNFNNTNEQSILCQD